MQQEASSVCRRNSAIFLQRKFWKNAFPNWEQNPGPPAFCLSALSTELLGNHKFAFTRQYDSSLKNVKVIVRLNVVYYTLDMSECSFYCYQKIKKRGSTILQSLFYLSKYHIRFVLLNKQPRVMLSQLCTTSL